MIYGVDNFGYVKLGEDRSIRLLVEQFFFSSKAACIVEDGSLAVIKDKADVFRKTEAVIAAEDLEILQRQWLGKVLLLVTGIHDVVELLERYRGTSFHGQLIKAYGRRVKSIDDIFTLLDELWTDMGLKGLDVCVEASAIETALVARARILMSDLLLGAGHLIELATRTHNPAVPSARRAKVSILEDLLDRFVGKFKGNFYAALDVTIYLSSDRAIHRFLEAYVRTCGVKDYIEAMKLEAEIVSPEEGGRELADAVLEAVKANGVMIRKELRSKLQTKRGDPPSDPAIVVDGGVYVNTRAASV